MTETVTASQPTKCGTVPQSTGTIDAETLARVIKWIMPTYHNPRQFEVVGGRRLLMLSWLLRMRDETPTELARSIGCTRAALSKVAVNLSDRSGIVGPSQRGARTRSAYAIRQARIWRERKASAVLTLGAIL